VAIWYFSAEVFPASIKRDSERWEEIGEERANHVWIELGRAVSDKHTQNTLYNRQSRKINSLLVS